MADVLVKSDNDVGVKVR